MKYKSGPLFLLFVFWAVASAQSDDIQPVDPVLPDETVEAPTMEAVSPEGVENPEPAMAPASIATPTRQAASSGVFDEPDLSYETRLHDIYLNFNSQKMPADQWQSIAGDRSSEVYNIQSGDSLWTISKTLFSDGNYWPKIWSLNGSIQNPHLITEGNSIKFLMGDESEAPSFTISEDATETYDAQEEAVGSNSGSGGDIEIPPPLNPPKPLVRKLPPSLPNWQSDANSKRYDSAGYSYVRRPILDTKAKIKLSAYFDEDETKGVGTVKEVETSGQSAGQFQYVYVQLPMGSHKTGDRFMVVRNKGPLKTGHESIDKDSLGYQIQIQGEVVLEDKAEKSRKAENADIFRALITQNINPVEVGSVLVPGHWLYGDFEEHGPKSLVVAQIVGGVYDRKNRLFGSGDTTFLNRGSLDGLQVGQILPVRSNRQVRDAKSIVWENVRPIGYLKVVKVTPHLATAIVLKSFEDILAGDLTGQGPLLPQSGGAVQAKAVSEEIQEDIEEEKEEPSIEDAEESAEGEDALTHDPYNSEESETDSDLDSEIE